MTTVVLADDHVMVREGLQAFLNSVPEIKVVGSAGDGLEAVQVIERLQPDVLVLDLMMGSMNAVDTVRQVRKKAPKTKVIILSMFGNEEYVLATLRAGAMAYILKDSPPSELIRAINEVRAGRHFLAARLSEMVIDNYLNSAPQEAADPYDTLTRTERTILGLVLDGSSSAKIAQRLVISPRTVEVHRANLMRKLGLHSRTDIIRWAAQRNMLPPGDSPLAEPESKLPRTGTGSKADG